MKQDLIRKMKTTLPEHSYNPIPSSHLIFLVAFLIPIPPQRIGNDIKDHFCSLNFELQIVSSVFLMFVSNSFKSVSYLNLMKTFSSASSVIGAPKSSKSFSIILIPGEIFSNFSIIELSLSPQK
ncbi:hypothetical protein Bhyg_11086 [Pseudolycoriella hygida]|uniref:Uncharacterized protein n=1 Tax=Pseudolycoriella hygida TaxID=35572 RepID=A0A9Q0MUM9_9DIPT|nr:hypothetical protein Bhyg_11086 [Pseudolycoriella hygida]